MPRLPFRFTDDAGRGGLVAAGAVVLAGCAVIAHAARGVTFSGDDWAFILSRRGFGAGVFLRPHGEHLSALPVAAYKVLLATFGAGSYVPFMALLLVLHAICCMVLYVLARRHVGPWAALAPVAILAVLGPAWQDLLWAFQIGYLGSLAAGLGMALCLDADHPRDSAAAALLIVSLLCSSIGLAMAVFGLVLIVIRRPLHLRRLWVVILPLALYLLWYAFYGVSTIRTGNITRIPSYLGQALSASLATVTGLASTEKSPYLISITYGRILAVAAGVGLVLTLVRRRRFARLAWAALAAAVALWVAECLEYFPNGREAAQSRYQYTAAALILLVAAAVVRIHPRRPAGALLGLLTAAICASNVSLLDREASFWRKNSTYVKAEAGALQLARDRVDPRLRPENLITDALIGNHNFRILAGPYLSATRAFGSPGDSVAKIEHRPESVREAADVVLAGADRLTLAAGGAITGRCRRAHDGTAVGELTLEPGSQLTIRVEQGIAAQLLLRRLAADYRFVVLGNAPPPFARFRLLDGRPMHLALPTDRSRLPWHVRIAGGRDVVVCLQ